ncbi:hypothetical protein BC628DRAFT_1096393 [Trametes gibbosa]|nr:hypothetical protein BC628DRAFT_1096393 [Trametes gibbosa]
MQFSAIFVAIAALASVAIASPAVVSHAGSSCRSSALIFLPAKPVVDREVSASIISEAELAHWLATTDAELTFIGEPFNPLAKRSAQTTTVTYCTKSVGPICGGTCTVYNGGAACIDAAGTTCIAATRDIGFCDLAGCAGNCNALSQCGTSMSNGFCFTPDTQSILVSSL